MLLRQGRGVCGGHWNGVPCFCSGSYGFAGLACSHGSNDAAGGVRLLDLLLTAMPRRQCCSDSVTAASSDIRQIATTAMLQRGCGGGM
jgi:hypothetical protein